MNELLDQDWCVEHYLYFYKDEGCFTCQYEDDLRQEKTNANNARLN